MTDEAKALVYRMRNLQVLEYPQDRIRCADLIETQAREIERLSYALGCIVNEDWKDMTVELARDTARAALGDTFEDFGQEFEAVWDANRDKLYEDNTK